MSAALEPQALRLRRRYADNGLESPPARPSNSGRNRPSAVQGQNGLLKGVRGRSGVTPVVFSTSPTACLSTGGPPTCRHGRRFRSLPEPSKDVPEPSGDVPERSGAFRSIPETFRSVPETSQSLPERSGDVPEPSGACWDASDKLTKTMKIEAAVQEGLRNHCLHNVCVVYAPVARVRS